MWVQTVVLELRLGALNQGPWQQRKACALFQSSCRPSADVTFHSRSRGPGSLCGPP